MDTEDLTFKRTFQWVLGVLVAITLVVIVAARFIASSDDETSSRDERVQALVEERIRPIGKVQTQAPDEQPDATVAAAAEPVERSGEDVYAVACAACHATGAAGAPKTGDAAAWESRLSQGLDALVASALNGKGAMPARGGNATLTEEEIEKAVKHMTGL